MPATNATPPCPLDMPPAARAAVLATTRAERRTPACADCGGPDAEEVRVAGELVPLCPGCLEALADEGREPETMGSQGEAADTATQFGHNRE